MQKRLLCEISSLACQAEVFLFISINEEDILSTIALFTALRLKKIDSILLVDSKNANTTTELLQIYLDLKTGNYTIEYDRIIIKATADWVDAILGLLVQTWLDGWSPLAHIDQEFHCTCGSVTLCVNILAPN